MKTRRITLGSTTAAAAAAAANADTTIEDATTKAFAEAGYTLRTLSKDANTLPLLFDEDPRALRRAILIYGIEHQSTYRKRMPTTSTKNQTAEQANAWSTWKLNIINHNHHFGDLEMDIMGAFGEVQGFGSVEHEPKKTNTPNVLLTWRRENRTT